MLLGLDLGTGSAKALLLATDASTIGEASSSYPVHAPQPEWAESEPRDWWLAVASAVQISGQPRGVCPYNRMKQPCRIRAFPLSDIP